MDNNILKSHGLLKGYASLSTRIDDKYLRNSRITSPISTLYGTKYLPSREENSVEPGSVSTSSFYKNVTSSLRPNLSIYPSKYLPSREESRFESTYRINDKYISKIEDINPESTFHHTPHTNRFTSTREERSDKTNYHHSIQDADIYHRNKDILLFKSNLPISQEFTDYPKPISERRQIRDRDEELLRKLEKLEKKYEKLKIENVSINAVLDETLEKNKELSAQNLLLRRNINELKVQVAELPIESDFANFNLEETLTNLRIENNNLKKSLSEMENMLEKKTTAIIAVRDKYKSIQENSVSPEQAKLLRNHINSLQKELESSKAEIDQLNISNSDKNIELELSQRERRILEAEIANMKLLRLSTKSLPMRLTTKKLEDQVLNSNEIPVEQNDDFHKFPTWWRRHMIGNHITDNGRMIDK